VLNLMLLHCT